MDARGQAPHMLGWQIATRNSVLPHLHSLGMVRADGRGSGKVQGLSCPSQTKNQGNTERSFFYSQNSPLHSAENRGRSVSSAPGRKIAGYYQHCRGLMVKLRGVHAHKSGLGHQLFLAIRCHGYGLFTHSKISSADRRTDIVRSRPTEPQFLIAQLPFTLKLAW